MKSGRVWLLVGAILLVTIIGLGQWLGGDEVKVLPDTATVLPRALSSSQAPVLPASGVVAPAPGVASDVPLLPLPEQQVDAAESMNAFRSKADPSVPPVVHSPPGEAATAAELADPKAYHRYEERQNQRIYDAYVKAAGTEIPKIQENIARARREGGVSEEEIRKAEEKVRRIQAMRDQLQADHPEPAPAAPAAVVP